MAESAYFNIRRARGDMIQVYNVVSGKLNNQPTVKLNLSHVSNVRGNIYKMHLTYMHYNLRKHFFSNRIVVVWNSLPNTVVSAESTNIFKISIYKTQNRVRYINLCNNTLIKF
jgi:hypothetical protein